jgi:hypothetical protein
MKRSLLALTAALASLSFAVPAFADEAAAEEKVDEKKEAEEVAKAEEKTEEKTEKKDGKKPRVAADEAAKIKEILTTAERKKLGEDRNACFKKAFADKKATGVKGKVGAFKTCMTTYATALKDSLKDDEKTTLETNCKTLADQRIAAHNEKAESGTAKTGTGTGAKKTARMAAGKIRHPLLHVCNALFQTGLIKKKTADTKAKE